MNLHRSRRTLTALTAVALIGGALSACSAAPSSNSTPSAHTTSAGLHMVKNDGHQLAFHVTTGTLPAIVLDAGGGNDSSYWNNLVPILSKRTGAEIITYDRSGMGRSEAVPGAFSVTEAASDLHVGLTKLGAAGDAVLVSHSEAGEVAVNLVQQHPKDITGAVLVDASLPQFYTPTETARVVAANAPVVAAAKAQPTQTQATKQLIALAENYGPDHAAYHKLAWPKSIPATVIVSATTPFDTASDAALWRKAASAFAAAGPDRRLVTAAHSSHDIPHDRPGLIADEITRMVKDGH
ncbi:MULTISPECIES: alpha/beta fold hydrolase [unclassified Curtobacterium]|uniref:alpha/beta fold hydrolase n=1 Tax=unclassified Curtobacterium TaxID=257496 RepID=UPI0008DD21C0|nr:MULTISPECIES: alpha/beta hydrolase [unclassified Curtobacterium]OIH94174.1 hypothetical protein BIU92_07010 [Curtobacterium sp. MCBA15_003]OII29330.1 hypothetical protein BIU94_12990 [Curtobacterium sp. MMLR14_006]